MSLLQIREYIKQNKIVQLYYLGLGKNEKSQHDNLLLLIRYIYNIENMIHFTRVLFIFR